MELDKRTWSNKVTGPSHPAALGKGVGTCAEEVGMVPVSASPAFSRSVGQKLETILNPLRLRHLLLAGVLLFTNAEMRTFLVLTVERIFLSFFFFF